MTTPTFVALPERVRRITAENINGLQRGYLADQPRAVAALARLRRGAGKEVHQVPDLWGLIDTGPLHDPTHEGGLPPRDEDLTRAEDAVHVALTLWALHQQSRGTGMHQPDRKDAPAGLGSAVRRLMPKGDIDEAILKRLVRAGHAPDLPSLAQRLREIVLLLRREDIALDYALLAGQLCHWQRPGGRDEVRRAWGRSFHAYRPTKNSEPDPHDPAGSTPAAGLASDSDTTKDAS
ncbi:type I-E CRISPR-associated protein Cse2/CasB [Streptomyces viridochromogenes]|uniref:type I-E CRISPR-associated protein Cse2/CasB n=1 Tax=Streptomyces viridochromogenes TaxID=1938 RepID=UPI00069F387A|nr:type I-E CRISPR-associated protein Cse2/CasB [Streptomyces viridochromogenes]KOG07705.1 CRISPR-associated protein [Streptomyces viridochromogenes]KOG12847.1 CRISPR-associated protein [Streptomyces viridochromogenes]